jgi:ketosteroid isomerase-like protein
MRPRAIRHRCIPDSVRPNGPIRTAPVRKRPGVPTTLLPQGRGSGRRPAALCAALLGAMLLTGCARPAADHPEIRSVLAKQSDAWNRGDLEGYMQGYWKSDETVFRSPKGETRGWQAVLDRYRQSYPSRDKMGQLTFQGLQVSQTADDLAEVSGRYCLKPADPKAAVQTGRFYLTMRRINGAWVIVKDYTIGS